jgi:gluconokinase
MQQGVSGSGKTTLGTALAEALSLPFIDADDLHSEANKDKMSRGEPLTDADRGRWLVRVRRAAVEAVEGKTSGGMPGVVVACSALKASYRAVLRGERPDLDSETCSRGGVRGEAVAAAVSGEKPDHGGLAVAEEAKRTEMDRRPVGARWTPPLRTFFVHPFGARAVLLERLQGRESHFMKAEMLWSQLETLENPKETAEEGVVEIRIEESLKEQVRAAVEGLGEVVLPHM